MIIRYSISLSKGRIKNDFERKAPNDYKPIYNASTKSTHLPIITIGNKYEIELFSWGLIPFDTNDTKIAEKLTNARIETILAKAPYHQLVNKNRCLILADSFFIWKEANRVKTPYKASLPNNKPFYIAGLFDKWQTEENDSIFKSFSMITQESRDGVSLHNDRMPVVFDLENGIEWLNEKFTEKEVVDFAKKNSISQFELRRVSNLVDNENINTPKIIREIENTSPGQTLSLFD